MTAARSLNTIPYPRRARYRFEDDAKSRSHPLALGPAAGLQAAQPCPTPTYSYRKTSAVYKLCGYINGNFRI